MRTYDVQLRMSTERQSMDAVNRRLQPVREVAKRQGFHISELRARGEEGDRRDLLEEGSRA